MNEPTPQCLVCKRSNQEVPLLALNYKEQTYWICPQHLPVLIHKPDSLIGLLPGAENLTPHSDD
jgi:hypothetical protein